MVPKAVNELDKVAISEKIEVEDIIAKSGVLPKTSLVLHNVLAIPKFYFKKMKQKLQMSNKNR